jgi:NADH-quinone oxidoreductase subunit M
VAVSFDGHDIPLLAALIAAILAPLAAAFHVSRGGSQGAPRTPAMIALLVSLVAGLTITLFWMSGPEVTLELGQRLGGGYLVHVDGLTAVLLPFVGLVELAIVMVAPNRFLDGPATVRILLGAATTLALFSTAHPLVLIVAWVVTALPTWWSTRATAGGQTAARVYAIMMTLAVACMASGTLMMIADPPWEAGGGFLGASGGWLVALAVLVRKGIVPFHSWYPALFRGAPMSTALAATMPQIASYTAVRLFFGHADHGDGVGAELVVLSQLALLTATYGAALALVQRDLRGLIGTLAMSQSALVLAGLAGKLPMELNGAFCTWISSGLALTGLGLVGWALESRAGPLSLETPQGRFADAPLLAAFFLLFGLSSIGLPGTLSFVADDLLVSGSLDEQLHAGLLVIAATVLSAISVMRGWFMVFGGPSNLDGPRHHLLPRERIALTALFATIVLLGLWPAALVRELERAGSDLLGVPVEAHGYDAAAVGWGTRR